MTKVNQKRAEILETVKNYAMEIPADEVREPNMPVDTYGGEVQNTLAAARRTGNSARHNKKHRKSNC
jgi:hypothetical protein